MVDEARKRLAGVLPTTAVWCFDSRRKRVMSTIVTSPQPASPAPATLLTAEEFALRYGGQYVEVVDGMVKALPRPFPKQGKICMTIGCLILDHALKHDLGHVMSNDSFVKTRSNPDTVLRA